jgi:hypothetical protein
MARKRFRSDASINQLTMPDPTCPWCRLTAHASNTSMGGNCLRPMHTSAPAAVRTQVRWVRMCERSMETPLNVQKVRLETLKTRLELMAER